MNDFEQAIETVRKIRGWWVRPKDADEYKKKLCEAVDEAMRESARESEACWRGEIALRRFMRGE